MKGTGNDRNDGETRKKT